MTSAAMGGEAAHRKPGKSGGPPTLDALSHTVSPLMALLPYLTIFPTYCWPPEAMACVTFSVPPAHSIVPGVSSHGKEWA